MKGIGIDLCAIERIEKSMNERFLTRYFTQEERDYIAQRGQMGVQSAAADKAAAIQEKTSFLPDYAFADSDSAAGTTVSGLVGSAIVAALAVLICFLGGFFRKKNGARK